MTYDELLAKINKGGTEAFESDSCGWLALSAVLELHKPISHKGYEDEGFFCDNCEYDYPCPTIQAIEKELE